MNSIAYLLETPQIIGGIISLIFMAVSIAIFISYNRSCERRRVELEKAHAVEMGKLKNNIVNARGIQLVRDSLDRMGNSLSGLGAGSEEAKQAYGDLKKSLSHIPSGVMPDEFIRPDDGFWYFCEDNDHIVYRQVRFAFIPIHPDDEH